MRYKEFIDLVQDEANLESPEQAREITRATLETLGERLGPTERDDLAAQLPGELKDELLRRSNTDRYTLEAFFERVGARAGTGYQEAEDSARAVVHALRQAVSRGQIEQIFSQLPQEYHKLLDDLDRESGSPELE